MNSEHLIAGFLILLLSSSAWSQGLPVVAGEASMQIERSTELKAEGQEFQKKVAVTLEYQQKRCAATLGLEYYQKGPHAHVKSTLKNEQCAASSGTYVLRVRFIPDEGEMGDVEFEESWTRDDNADVVTEKYYYVGNDLEIRRITSARLICECTEAKSQEQSPASEPPKHRDGGT